MDAISQNSPLPNLVVRSSSRSTHVQAQMASRGDSGSQVTDFPGRGCNGLDSGALGSHSSSYPGLLGSIWGSGECSSMVSGVTLLGAAGGDVFPVNSA